MFFQSSQLQICCMWERVNTFSRRFMYKECVVLPGNIDLVFIFVKLLHRNLRKGQRHDIAMERCTSVEVNVFRKGLMQPLKSN